MSDLENFLPQDIFGELDKKPTYVRIFKKNAKQAITTIEGLSPDLDFNKLLKAFKKYFNCNGTIVYPKEGGKVIQLQGDQRQQCYNFMIREGVVEKHLILYHGY